MKIKNNSLRAFSFTLALLTVGGTSSFAQDFNGFGTVPDEKEPELNASLVIDGTTSSKESKVQGKTITSSKEDESVLLVKDKAKAQVSKSQLNKTSGDTTNDGQSNFYGLNAAVVSQNGSTLSLKDVVINTSADGSNAVFSTGEGSSISAKNITIHTTENSSRGLDATYGGVITASNVDITTEGAHCASFATDRGEGTVTVNGGKAKTSGEGSPVIYSTGNISVKNLVGEALGSEIAVIEGKNSITIQKSNLSGSGTQGIMLYQSMSGDANQGTSVFTVSNSTLSTSSKGPFFYITNTEAAINISGTSINTPSSVLIRASGNNSERGWGEVGANGGTLTFNAQNQTLVGDIVCDSISSIDLNLGNKTVFKGAINESGEGCVNLSLAKNAKIYLTSDSYVNKLSSLAKDFSNIVSNGHTLYYNTDEAANKALQGRTISLSDGGKIAGLSMGKKTSTSQRATRQSRGKEPHAMMGDKAPKMDTISGTVANGENGTLTLLTSSGTYNIEAAKAPGGNGQKPGDKGNMGNKPNDKPRDMPQPNGDKGMPAPQGERRGEHGLTEDALKALVGKSVKLTGFFVPTEKSGQKTFAVINYSEN